MAEDIGLAALRAYARDRCEDAYIELVHRYVVFAQRNSST